MLQAGILLIDKPAGISSAKAIAHVKKQLGVKKIGHAGTLDPMATGLLVALTNGATRLAQYAEGGRKVYTGTIRLGITSDSDDVTGTCRETGVPVATFPKIATAAESFIGSIEQVPPNVSAVKIDGKRAYSRVRRGEQITIAPRAVTVYSFSVRPGSSDTVAFRVECSKGTYIRSLARDMGELLGCGGCLASLRREVSWPFSVDDALPPEKLTSDALLSWVRLFPEEMRVALAPDRCEQLKNGDLRALRELAVPSDRSVAIYCDESTDTPLGVLRKTESCWEIAVNLPADSGGLI